MIKYLHVTRKFNDFTAVDEVSFEIGKGHIVGLLGPNGAGKTTVMKMLTGFLEPTSGSIYVDDFQMGHDTTQIQSRLGYLPENCPLWTDMTVIDYLSYHAALHNILTAENKNLVLKAIRRTKLIEKATQPIRSLSKGYRQRVGVAQAILHNPEIIILDEPTNGLDPTQTINMRELIRELAKTSTVILSTHIMQEVQALCERVIILHSGKIVKDALLDEINQDAPILITIDQDEQIGRPILEKIQGVNSVKLKNKANGSYQYSLEADLELNPIISEAVTQAGFKLYELAPERRDLETLFTNACTDNLQDNDK